MQRSQSRREGGGNKLADLFGSDAQGNEASVSKSVSFKYKANQSAGQKPVESQTNGTTTNTTSQRNVLYQETVQLYNYKDQSHVHLGAAGVAILGTAAGSQLLVYLSKQKTIANVPITPSFNITLQKDNYVCFYDQKSQLWYLLFPDFVKLVSFSMHILISKYLNEDPTESRVRFMEVQSGDASEVVTHTSKVRIKYASHVVDGAKVGKKVDGNKESTDSKILNVDLTAKKGAVISGLKDGLVGMSRDSVRVILIPPKFAYGSSGIKNKVPPNSYLIYEAAAIKITQLSAGRSQRTSSSEVPLPRLSSRGGDEDDQMTVSGDEGSEDDDDTQADQDDDSPESSSNTTTDDAPNSSSVTRAKILQRTAKLGQAVLPPKREHKASPKTVKKQSPSPAVDEMSYTSSAQPIYPNGNQVALYNPPVAAGSQMYPQPGAPLMSSMQPQMPTYQHPTHLQSTIMPTSALMPTPLAFGASTTAVTSSTLDQSASNNLQLVMLESKQIQSDVRNQVMQVSTKLDQVHQKVETLASRDSMMGTSGSQVTLEAAVLVQNIQRIVQENERLKQEAEQSRITTESQTEKIASLLAQNQKYLEQSNIMLEQRNESFQSVSSASQIKITQLEQEKTQMLNELNSLNNKISELQFDLSTQKQRQLDFKSQVNEEAVGKNQLREEVASQKVKISELEEDFSKAKNAYREQRAARKHAEARIVDLEEQLTDSKSEVDSLNRQLSERRRRAEAERETQQKEMEDMKQMHLSEIDSWKSRLDQQRKVGSEASLALGKVEADLDNQWREKCDAMVKQTRNQLEDQLKLANERSENLQGEISTSKTKIVELNSAVSNLKRDLIESQEQLHLKKDEVLSLQSEIDKLQYELERNRKSVSSEVLLPEVKKIMNTIYQVLAKHIDKESKYTGSSLLAFMKLVIKDVTLSVSSGKQPNCLTDSSTLIEPIPEDESDEEEDDDAEGSSTEEDEKEIASPKNKDELVKNVEPVSKKYSVASEGDVSPETEEIVGSSNRTSSNAVIHTIVQSDSVESDVSETSIIQTDRVKRQSQTGPAFDTETFSSDSEEKDDTGDNDGANDAPATLSKDASIESQNRNDSGETSAVDSSAGNVGDLNSALTGNDASENSDSEGAVMLDPRNIPSSDSENEENEHDLSLDADHSQPLTEDNQNEPTEVLKRNDGESQNNEEPILVTDSHEDLANNEPVQTTANIEEEELSTLIPVENIDPVEVPLVIEPVAPNSQELFGDSPPPLPESPRVEPPSDTEIASPRGDTEGNDRVVGGASLPAFRSTTPSSGEVSAAEDNDHSRPKNVPGADKIDTKSDDSDDEFPPSNKKVEPPSQKSQKIFDDSDSDDSLFGSSTKVAKPQSASPNTTNSASTTAKNDLNDAKNETPANTTVSEKKKTPAPLFPSDDEDEDLDWLRP